MKKILYLTFYFEPDLCAGSFRNSPLVKELAKQTEGKAEIDVFTTLPNRYSSFSAEAPEVEKRGNYTIRRVAIPKHRSGMKDQMFSFKKYYSDVKKMVRGKKYDLVVASSSRLFTAYLGYSLAKKMKAPLYLDIRDIFYDTMEDVLQSKLMKAGALPVIKQIERRTFNYASHINLISAGFKPYFADYDKASYSYFPNGIDDIFIEASKREFVPKADGRVKTIVYAGNIGEGQGLHRIVPQAAKELGEGYKFVIIGDGGAKPKLIEEIERLGVSNVEMKLPVKRDELIEAYHNADFLFAHLNDYDAFKKVLPSKLFELASFPQPVIAGVGGFAANFVKNNIENSILFEPCNVTQFVSQMKKYEYQSFIRTNFINQFGRAEVNHEMAKGMWAMVE